MVRPMSAGRDDQYETLAGEGRGELELIKGSRFLARLAPVDNEDEAAAFLERVRAEFKDASHHCWAWRLGHPSPRFRSADDGEPSGSAGRPILAQLEGHDLSDLAVVVVRWFGGTKLGVGGLMRAYGGAAGHALDRAARRTVLIRTRLEVEHPYACEGAVQGLLAARSLVPVDPRYGEHVAFAVEVVERDVEDFTRELADRTAGRARVQRG